MLQPWLFTAADLVMASGDSTANAPSRPYSGTWLPAPLVFASLPQDWTGIWLLAALYRPWSPELRLLSLRLLIGRSGSRLFLRFGLRLGLGFGLCLRRGLLCRGVRRGCNRSEPDCGYRDKCTAERSYRQ